MTIDYSKGKIYIIKNHNNLMVYIGSTTQSLCQRFAGHKRSCNNKTKNHRPMYQDMIKYGSDTIYIETLEYVNAKDKNELLKIEGKYIKEYRSEGVEIYNKEVAGRTAKEYSKQYREVNRDKLSVKKREYREANKDEINAKKCEKITCTICISTVSRVHLSRHNETITHIKKSIQY